MATYRSSHDSDATRRKRKAARHSSDSDGGDTSSTTLDACIGRLSRRVGRTGHLTAKSHECAVRILTEIRDRILRGEQACSSSNVMLVCCGVSVERRRLLVSERDELREDMLRTAVLIFVTVCLVEHQRRGELEDAEADKHIQTLQRAASASLWRRSRPIKKNAVASASSVSTSLRVAALDPTSEPGQKELRPWREIIQEAEEAKEAPPSDGDVCYSAMCSGVLLLGGSSIATFEGLSEIFYRHSMLQLVASSLQKSAGADFLSLSATAFCSAVNTDGVSPSKCRALIAAGESEAGQQVRRTAHVTWPCLRCRSRARLRNCHR